MASSVILERALGALALAVFAVSGILVLSITTGSATLVLYLTVLCMFITTVGAVMALFSPRIHSYIIRLGCLYVSQRVAAIIEQVRQSILKFSDHLAILRLFFVLSLFEQLFPIATTYMIFKAFDLNLPLIWAAIGVPAILLMSRIPISLNSIGIQEGAFAFVFSFAGVPASASILMSIIARVLILGSMLPGAFYSWRTSGPVHLTRKKEVPVISGTQDPAPIK